MAVELAAAYVSIVPSAKGMKEELGKLLDLDDAASKAAKSASKGLGKRLGSIAKKTMAGVGAVAAGAFTAAVVKGWGRLTAIEEAQSKLTGLGHSAKTVDVIMGNALASVKGTAFGLDEAATSAANAVAAGIKPGRELERVLKLIGDTAAIAGASMGETGAIFNKVAASNRLSMAEVNQLANRGVPILQMLAKELNVTQGEAAKLVSKGEVDFARFAASIEANIAGAALETGNTTAGAFANMWAAAGRFGAALLEGVFPMARKVFGGITEWIDRATTAAKPWAEGFARLVGDRMVPAAQSLVERARELKTQVGEFLQSAEFQQIKTTTLERLESIFSRLVDAGKVLGPALAELGASIAEVAPAVAVSSWKAFLAVAEAAAVVLAAIAPVVASVAEWFARNDWALRGLLTTYIAYRAAVAAVRTVTAAVTAVTAAYRAVTVGLTAASYGAAGAAYAQGAAARVYAAAAGLAAARTRALTMWQKVAAGTARAWAAVQWLLNAALTANPVGLVVAAVAALVAAFVVAYKKSDAFRKVVHSALRAVGNAALWLWHKAIKPAIDAIGRAASWLWSKALKPVLDAITTAAKWIWSKALKPVLSAVARVSAFFAKAFKVWWQIVTSLVAVFKWAFGVAIKGVIAVIIGQIKGWGAAIGWVWTNVVRPAIQGVGAIFQWLWTHAIQPAIHAAGAAISWLWTSVIQPSFAAISAAAVWLWENGIRPAFNAVAAAASWLWNVGFKPAFEAISAGAKLLWQRGIKPAFDTVKNIISNAWNNVIKPTFNRVMGTVRKVRDTFDSAFGAIGGFISSAFDGAVSTVKGAINAVIRVINSAINNINNNIIANVNKIPGANFPYIPNIPELAKGGVVPATPGGRVVRVAEGGQAEAIIPLDKLDKMMGGSTTIVIDGTGLDRSLSEWLRRAVRTRAGGSVQAFAGRV